MTRTPLFAATAIIISFAATIRILAAQPAAQDRTDVGKQVFKSANCVGCHKWHGNGGGGYGAMRCRCARPSLPASRSSKL